MDNITKKVKEEIDRGWIGSDRNCSYHPCHFSGQDCTFCYCPFYPCNDTDFGSNIESTKGKTIWECTSCLFIHRPEVGRFVMSSIKNRGIIDPKDPEIREIFVEAKSKFHRTGRSLMVLGATSDAGKSLAVIALCRILHKKGYLVAPFKSQNMSLNSKVTMKGSEIAMIQTIQSKAAGLKNPDHHMNPILLKPKGDAISQVMVEGKAYGDYGVEDYYEKFVPGPGTETVKRNVDFLKDRYDYVVMEGAGSPAEINIYDKDIANMRAAEIADANCILVINVEWGGSFAYALGTMELIPSEDRGRIKGVILNNIRGNIDNFSPGIKELERITEMPVIGLIPHIDLELPSEDSEAFRETSSKGDGKTIISVIKFPRIANFTDLDPLCMEDVTLRFISDPKDLGTSDAIILPGTKNTIDDLNWMKGNGLFDAIKDIKGKVPILGICGGYQMMGKLLKDPQGLEGKIPSTTEGLGLFNNITEWGEYKKKVIQDSGILLSTGEPVTGYEIHMGTSEVNEEPIFKIDRFKDSEMEGSLREKEMLFGTYLHGVFEKPAFRKFFLSFVRHDGMKIDTKDVKDYDDLIEENIEKLATVFEMGLDMEMLMKIAEGKA
jgi:cobyric acid synthase CobQ